MKWGDWELRPDNWTLLYRPQEYEIDLEAIHSSAEILDWIFQIWEKEWCDAETLGDLLTAFNDILYPQKNYCSFGKDSQADGAQLARAFFANKTQG